MAGNVTRSELLALHSMKQATEPVQTGLDQRATSKFEPIDSLSDEYSSKPPQRRPQSMSSTPGTSRAVMPIFGHPRRARRWPRGTRLHRCHGLKVNPAFEADKVVLGTVHQNSKGLALRRGLQN